MYLIILQVGWGNWYGSFGVGQFGRGWRLRKVSLSCLAVVLRGLICAGPSLFRVVSHAPAEYS